MINDLLAIADVYSELGFYHKFPTMSDLHSKHTLSSCSLAVLGNFRQSEICLETGLWFEK